MTDEKIDAKRVFTSRPLESVSWPPHPGTLSRGRAGPTQLAREQLGKERARCKRAWGRPGRWRAGVGSFARKGSPGSSPG